jgi:DNA-directed RNA polymerase subunit K/omega
MSDYYSEEGGLTSEDEEYESSIEGDDIDDKTQTEIEEEEKLKFDLENNKEFDPFYNDFIEFEEMTELTSSKISAGTNHIKKKRNEDRKTKPYINKYEFTKLIGIRMEQITNGSQILLDTKLIKECKNNTLLMALREMETNNFPLILKRKYVDRRGDYTYEEWKVSEFININQMIKYYNN